MKIFNAAQIRAWDAFTIAQEPLRSIDLMNRAAQTFVDWFVQSFPDTQTPVYVFAGTGNNGGDGLAVARLLFRAFYDVKVFICPFTGKYSPDFEAQRQELPPDIALSTVLAPLAIADGVAVLHTRDMAGRESHTLLSQDAGRAIFIDALFGTGLSRPLEAPWPALIHFINSLPGRRVSIDLPSGLLADAPTLGSCIRADDTFTFQQPKASFFFSENAEYIGKWVTGDIGLHPDFAEEQACDTYFLEKKDVAGLLRPRKTFSHKGSFGHALLIAGSYGKTGAALLAAWAALRSGLGLLTVHAPRGAYSILQTAAPEAMFSADADEYKWTQTPETTHYQAIGIGPGIGTAAETGQALGRLLAQTDKPVVLDADALNLLARHPEFWDIIPKGSILTPHPKEFARLFGDSPDGFGRNRLQRERAQAHGVYIVLKGAYTAVAGPEGSCWFNATGNPGMATGGSGDVLTGLLTGLLAQGYDPKSACLLGVYLHGLAGDIAAGMFSQEAMIAGDLAAVLGQAWLALEK